MKKGIVLVLISVFLILGCANACATPTLQEGDRSTTSYTAPNGNPAFTFEDKFFYGGQSLPVYSGPGYEYYRASNGWAKVSTDEPIMAAGREGDWVLILYATSSGYRVGYIDRSQLKYTLSADELSFAYTYATITSTCSMTQDPISANGKSIVSLSAGDQVTYLADFYDKENWAFVEVKASGEWIRGFVPMNCVSY